MTRARTNDDTAQQIRDYHASGIGYREISKLTDCPVYTVRDIVKGRSHVNRARPNNGPVAPRVLEYLMAADRPQRVFEIASALQTGATNVTRALTQFYDDGKVNRRLVPKTTGAYEWSACGAAQQHPMLRWGLEARE